MTALIRRTVTLILCWLALIASPVAQAQVDASTPDNLVRSLSADILQAIHDDPSIKQAGPARLTELVNRKVLPYADFERTTRLAMGRAWRDATPEQQRELIDQFERLLIHTYAGATSRLGDQTVTLKPTRMAPDDIDVVVRTEIASQGKTYSVAYRLIKRPAGWRIYDVNVLGVWLVQAYRQQFADEISQAGVGGLLKFLTERNQQLARGVAPQ